MTKPVPFHTSSNRRVARSRSRQHLAQKKFSLESLEDRIVLAAPQFVSVQPNAGGVLSTGAIDVLNTSPRELTVRFDQAIDGSVSSLNGIEISRDGVPVTNVSRDLGLQGSTAVLRFAETLADDRYTINITSDLRNALGEPFDPAVPVNAVIPLDFELDLGTKVSAVVPQPITRAGGVLSQRLDQIEVYFDDTELNPTLVSDTAYYKLILTQDTVTNTDDVFIQPMTADYQEASAKVVLTFTDDLHNLAGGEGTFRLRVGTNEPDPSSTPLVPTTPGPDPGDAFDTGFDVGQLTHTSQIIQSSIDPSQVGVFEYNFYPLYGGTDEIQEFTLDGALAGTFRINFDGEQTVPIRVNASVAEVQTALENLPNIGVGNVLVTGMRLPDGPIAIQFIGDLKRTNVPEITLDTSQLAGGSPMVDTEVEGSADGLPNLITEAQKQRVRETMEILSSIAGVDVVETEDEGRKIVTGVPSLANPADEFAVTNGVNWNDEFLALGRQGEPSYFQSVFQSLVGISAGRFSGDIRLQENTREAVFPGNNTGYFGTGTDIDVYRFEISGTRPGLFAAEIVGERLGDSLLDSVLRLYQETDTGERELIAQNDDYYSEDSFLQLALDPGVYYIGVSSAGNDDYDPSVEDSGFGGTSGGDYELRLDFRAEITDSLRDISGVPLDGNGDGTPGGVFNFWFRTAAPSGTEIDKNEVQEFDIAGTTGGMFTIGFNGQDTSALPFDASVAAVQTAMESLSNIGAGNISVTGSALPDGPISIEFVGSLTDTDVAEITLNTVGLTGGTATVTTITEGGADRIIYVDKADTTPDTQPNVGSLENPYNVIHAALNLDIDGLPKTGGASDPNGARAGDVVRIIGNGSSPENSLPYEIGRNAFNNQPLADGAKLDIPNNVTMMVDAGAVFKMRRSAILVGSTAIGIDHALSGFQVLATPDRHAVFTSINDFGSGSPARGDWGGILFAGDLDQDSFRTRYEEQGIFLNNVTHADIRYGGGIVNVGSVPQEIAPIDIRDARPTVKFNYLMTNAVAAISATPDSFEETNFHTPEFQTTRFTADYARIGPDIQDNQLLNNTINGLFLRVETLAGQELQKLTVSARLNDADIVHVLSEVLEVRGTPGGALGNTPVTREDARLAIDPNVITKLDGARIETGVGAQLIAEGLDGQQVVFTSINDDRFGASGNFDTSNNNQSVTQSPGDWGGIYVGHSSSASLDHVLLTFGGGRSAVEGRFVGFNAVEIQQGQARIANSTFVDNAGGFTQSFSTRITDNREGRGINGAGTVFVRGAQPIIVNNIFLSGAVTDPQFITQANRADDLAAAININTNSLNRDYVTDYGRSTGMRDAFPGGLGNQGPLIRNNRLDDNDINGMRVRGETVDGEVVWDDTDIVHVLFENVHVPNFNTQGGIRLESTATESLVVKLGGIEGAAGFDATGTVGSNPERIGGTVHVIGQPGRPVVMTSIADDSAGAGKRLDGSFQNQTLRPGFADPGPAEGGFNIDLHISNEVALNNPTLVAALEEGARFWEEHLTDNITIGLDVFIANLGQPGTVANASSNGFTAPFDDVIQRMQMDAAPDEFDLLDRLPTFSQLTVQGPPGDFEVTEAVSLGYPNAKALGYNPAPVPSVNVAGATRDGQINVNLLVARETTVEGFVSTVIHEIGHTLGFSSSIPEDGNFSGATLTSWDLFRMEPGAGAEDFTNNPRTLDPDKEQVTYDGGIFDPVGLDVPGLTLGDIPVSRGTEPDHPDDGQPSHWRSAGAAGMNGINLGVMSPSGGSVTRDNDLRSLGLMGWDLVEFSLPAQPVPGNWRGIQLDELSNDRNSETVTELESSDSDASGANSIPDRAEFIGGLAESEYESDENLRLGFEVHGVLNEPGDVDVYSFEGIAGTEVWLDVDYTSSSLDAVLELINANGQTLVSSDDDGGDTYSTNPKDPGMQVILPGQPGVRGTYFVRVSSDGGQTQGAYELNMRLRDIDETPGSTVRHADIRYARNGIEATGLIAHSPIQSEFVEPSDTDSYLTALNVGTSFQTDRGEISISGSLEPLDVTDPPIDINGFDRIFVTDGVDYYQGLFDGQTLDIDFADGIDGADVHIAVYAVGTTDGENEDDDDDDIQDDEIVYDLVYFSDGSNVTDDQGIPLSVSSYFGFSDPFISQVGDGIGSLLSNQILLDGTERPVTYTGSYIVAVASQGVRPQELVGQYNQYSFTGQVSTGPLAGVDQLEFDLAADAVPVPFTLEDMSLFVISDVPAGIGQASALQSVNPFNGAAQQGQRVLMDENMSFQVASLGMRADGSLFSLSLGTDDASSGNFLSVDWADPRDENGLALPIVENLADDEIVTFTEVPPDDPMDPPEYEELDDGIQFRGMHISDTIGYGVGDRGLKDDTMMLMGADYVENIIYRIDVYPAEIDFNEFDPGTALPTEPVRETDVMSATYFGNFTGALTDIFEVGAFNTSVGGAGGDVQGLVELNGSFYGVTDAGGLYSFMPVDPPPNPPMLGGRTTSLGSVPGVSFAGLTLGPPDLEGGRFASTLFAITDDGDLYAFNTSGSQLSIFENGQSSISTNIVDVQGIAFSTLDENLWSEGRFSAIEPPEPFFTGNESTPGQFNRDFNFPGGAHGAFDLTVDLTADVPQDLPVLYFDYQLRTQLPQIMDRDLLTPNNNDTADPIDDFFEDTNRDAFRVYATTVNPNMATGTDWVLIGSNNVVDFVNPGDDRLVSEDGQEIFDNTRLFLDEDAREESFFRQARIPIGEFAGNLVTLRFEFASEGTFYPDMSDQARPGHNNGNYEHTPIRNGNDDDAWTDNQVPSDLQDVDAIPFLGVELDNVRVGKTERGEQVVSTLTTEVADGIVMARPPRFVVDFNQSNIGNIVGDYELYVRPGITPGETNDPSLGDTNLVRDQGQLIVQSNRIVNSEEYGIRIEASPRIPAAAPDLVIPNSSQLVRGPVVENNLIWNSGLAGIRFAGDETGTGAVTYGRIVNNTVVGSVTTPDASTGIEVGASTSPTLLNNLVAYTQDAITVETSSDSTVISGSLFHGNTNNGETGQFPIFSTITNDGTGSDGLFRNPSVGNFLLVDGAAAIDSAINSQEDRPSITSVTGSLGLDYFSPILAPNRDLRGQLRVDDPDVESPPGLGANVIKDRGAIERADRVGPRSELLEPADNASNDLDPDFNTVQTESGPFSVFRIGLVDVDISGNDLYGVGIDDFTVTAEAISVRRNGQELVQDLDYAFSYDSTNDIITLIPLAGVWIKGAYEIEVDNTMVTDLATNRLAPNRLDGTTTFLVDLVDDFETDFGDAPDLPYPTLAASSGPRHRIVPGFQLGATVTGETDGQPSAAADADAGDDGVVFVTDLFVGSMATINVTASATGLIDAWIDFDGSGSWDGSEQIFASQTVNPGTNQLMFEVPEGAAVGDTFARFRLSSVGGLLPTGDSNDGEVEDYLVSLQEPGSDFGDAPSPYPTLLADDGARHGILPGFYLGQGVDAESDGEPSANADADTDDGVAIPSLVPGSTSQLTIRASAMGLVDAWIDFNADGAWDSGEQVLSSVILAQGNNLIDIDIPVGATLGETAARFRFSSAGGLAPTGEAVDGEVEDYLVEIADSSDSWHNAADPTDVNGLGDGATPLDALLIINELNRRALSDPTTGELLGPVNPPPFYDVTNDSPAAVTVLDALLVVNQLNDNLNPLTAPPSQGLVTQEIVQTDPISGSASPELSPTSPLSGRAGAGNQPTASSNLVDIAVRSMDSGDRRDDEIIERGDANVDELFDDVFADWS